jgi:hypothetical protein
MQEEGRKMMKKAISLGLMVLMAAMFLTGISCAGDKAAQETEVQLKGALNMDNQFVDEDGQTYALAINDKTAELLDMPRQMIEIKGTLLEHEGQKTLSITDISPVTQ